MGPKPLRIRSNKIDGFIWVHVGEFRYLALFDHGSFGRICDTIKYLISKKSGITDNINRNFRKIRINSYNSLAIEKRLIFHNVTILIKSVVNKNNNNYYFNIFSEKGSYNDKFNTEYFQMNVCIL